MQPSWMRWLKMPSDEFDLKYMENAEDDLKELIADKSKKTARKAVIKSLKLMTSNHSQFSHL